MPAIAIVWDKNLKNGFYEYQNALNIGIDESQQFYAQDDCIMILSSHRKHSYTAILQKANHVYTLIYGQIDPLDCQALKNNQFTVEQMSDINGYFAIIVFNSKTREINAICDRYGIEPLYYHVSENRIIISSEISFFARCFTDAVISRLWVHEVLFFNYSIYNSPIVGVNRLLGHQILRILPGNPLIKLDNKKITCEINYSNLKDFSIDFNKKLNKVVAVNLANKSIALSVTNGWDARTVQSVIENNNLDFTGYTYGAPNSAEIIDSAKYSLNSGIPHKQILFDKSFHGNYEKYLVDSIYYSGGLNNTQRASLCHVYNILSDYDIVVTGIHFDQLFRGHGNIPASISRFVHNQMTGTPLDVALKREIALSDCDGYEHICSIAQKLWGGLGDPTKTETQLRYLINPVGANLFVGEIRLSRHFTNAFVPVWMNGIIDLSFNNRFTTIQFSHLAGRKSFFENRLQSMLIGYNSKKLSMIDIHMLRPDLFCRHPYWAISRRYIESFKNKFPCKDNMSYGPAEPNVQWINMHKDSITQFINSESSILRQIVDNRIMTSLIMGNDAHLIHKFLSIEIMHRLINNKWSKFAM